MNKIYLFFNKNLIYTYVNVNDFKTSSIIKKNHGEEREEECKIFKFFFFFF